MDRTSFHRLEFSAVLEHLAAETEELQCMGKCRAVVSGRRRNQELLRVRFGERQDLVDNPSELE